MRYVAVRNNDLCEGRDLAAYFPRFRRLSFAWNSSSCKVNMHGLVWCIMKCMQHLAYVANRNSRAESFAVSYCWAAALFSRLMFLVRKCKLLSKLTSFPTVTRKKRGLLQNGTELLYNRMCAKYVTIRICNQWLLAYIIIVQIAAVSYISFVFLCWSRNRKWSHNTKAKLCNSKHDWECNMSWEKILKAPAAGY